MKKGGLSKYRIPHLEKKLIGKEADMFESTVLNLWFEKILEYCKAIRNIGD